MNAAIGAMKKVLFITHIAGFLKPGNGGQLRSHYLLKEIARKNDVDVYCDKLPSNVESTSGWRDLALNRSVAPSKARWMRMLSHVRGGSRLTCYLNQTFGMVPDQPPAYPANLLNKWCNEFVLNCLHYDVIILDTLGYYPLQSWKATGRKVWLNAHNVDSVLNPYDLRVGKLETELTSLIDGVICCTQNDEERFVSMNTPGLQTVCWGNGTDIPNPPRRDHAPEPSSILFVGTLSYEPNITGLRWYLQEVHPKLIKVNPEYRFTIVGRAPTEVFLKELKSHERVSVIPNAPNLSEQYYRHSLCVVPLLSGSGSRLKISEGLIHGCPMVSTSIGAEGYLGYNATGLEIADSPQSFTNAAQSKLDNVNTPREEIQRFAMKNFTWSNLIRPEEINLA